MNSIPRLDQAFHPTHLPDFDAGLRPEEGQQKKSGRRAAARSLGLAAVAIVAGLVGFGFSTKAARDAGAVVVLQARVNAVPSVRTMIAKEEDAPRTIELTGNKVAFDSATLFARATGYISKRNVDIGSKVHEGDVLSRIIQPASRGAEKMQFERDGTV